MLRSIVIVDDQPLYRDLLRNELVGAVTIVAEVDRFDGAVQAVLDHRPDGVLVDVNMGERNGFVLARELLKMVPTLKIVFMSSVGEAVYKKMAGELGDAIFIEKIDLTKEILLDILNSGKCRGEGQP